MKIEAIQNHIVFKFIDRVTNNGDFVPPTAPGGIELLKSSDDSAGQSRWATIVSLGPECSDELRTPGCEIFVDNLMWTAGVDFDGSKVWRTDESHVGLYRFPEAPL
jgi:hypothetical protein